MPASAEEELSFIMTCLKHTEGRGKPDFAAVAAELGIKQNTCYHRHWALLKKWGVTSTRAANTGQASTTGNTDGSGTGTSAPKTPRTPANRPRAKDTAGKNKKKDAIDDAEDDSDEAEDTFPNKRHKKSAKDVAEAE